MGRDEILETLRRHIAEIRAFGVSRPALFGVGCAGRRTTGQRRGHPCGILRSCRPFFEFMRTQRCLERLLGRAVDLATPDAIRTEMRERILKEAAYVAWGLEDARSGYSRGRSKDTRIHERGLVRNLELT